MPYPKVLAFILAGGKGERLFPLTSFRSKPSVPFGGRYRIVDFVLSNFVNSQMYSLYLLVQYKSQSLIEHVRQNWNLTSMVKDHFVAVVPPQMRMGPEWFQGTADAVFQNINLIKDHRCEHVVIFGADHIYRMDIRQMLDFHLAKDAAVTVAARPVPIEQASAFGVIAADSSQRITAFQEKPKDPASMPGDASRAYVSMGNYIFRTEVLIDSLVRAQSRKEHDFGANIIPGLVPGGKVFAYDFATNTIPDTKPFEEKGYWRDVGTIRAYFDAHRDLLGAQPAFDIFNDAWPIHPSSSEAPAAKILCCTVDNSIIAEGSLIKGASIKNSIIRSGCVIEEGVTIEDCIISERVTLGKGVHLKNVIVDKYNTINEGEQIGFDPDKDRFRCFIDQSGIAIIPRAGRISGPFKE